MFGIQAPVFRDDPESSPFWNRPLALCAIVFLIASGVRAAQFFFLRSNDPSFEHILPVVDSKTYDDLSQAILAGDWMLRSVPVHFMGPLYAYFLAAIYGLFGHHYEAAHAVQYLLGASSAAIIFLAARQWFSNRVAFVAGLFPALSATLIVYEGYLLPEGMIFFLVSLFMLALGIVRRHPGHWQLWLILGLVLGLVSIQRASFFMCGFGLVFWILAGFAEKDFFRRSIQVAFFVSGIVIAIAPVTLHNRFIGGQWVPVTSNGAINFYIGNGIEADGTFGYGATLQQHEKKVAAGQATWMGLLGSEIMADPTRWFALMFKKIYLYWAAYDTPDNFNYALHRQFSPLTQFGQLPYYIVAVLGFIGMAAAWSRRHGIAELYLLVFLCMFSIVLVFVSGRFRLAAMAPMSIFASVAVWKAVAWVQSRQWPRFAAAAAGAVVLVIFLTRYIVEPFPIRINDYSMLAAYYDIEADQEGAIAVMQGAVRAFETPFPGNAGFEQKRQFGLFNARGELASRLARAGRWQEARVVLERQMQSNVYDAAVVLMLIQSYIQLGEKNRALVLARRMLDSAPDNAQLQSLMRQAQSLTD